MHGAVFKRHLMRGRGCSLCRYAECVPASGGGRGRLTKIKSVHSEAAADAFANYLLSHM